MCAPLRGNFVWVLWLKGAPDQSPVVWQTEQSCGNPAATWLGLVVPCSSFRWQEMQAVERPANTLFTWQVAQGTLTWAPVSGNDVLLWSKLAFVQSVVVWQIWH